MQTEAVRMSRSSPSGVTVIARAGGCRQKEDGRHCARFCHALTSEQRNLRTVVATVASLHGYDPHGCTTIFRTQFEESQNLKRFDFRACRDTRRGRPALPAPWTFPPRLDALRVHSLGALEGVRSGAGCGDNSFLVIQPTGRVGLTEALLAHGAAQPMSSTHG